MTEQSGGSGGTETATDSAVDSVFVVKAACRMLNTKSKKRGYILDKESRFKKFREEK